MKTARKPLRLAVLRSAIAWPLLALLLVALLWTLLIAELRNKERALRAEAFERAALLANGYAGQVGRAIQDYDRTILSVALRWRESHGKYRLEPLARQGLYPDRFMLLLTDSAGNVISSLHRPDTMNVAERAYFRRHKSGEATSLFVSRVEHPGVRPVLAFSRPLLDEHFRFSGVAVACLLPELLFSPEANPSHGPSDFVAIHANEGFLVASWIGNRRSDDKSAGLPGGDHWTQGRRLAPGSDFEDGQARFLAWQALPGVPLTLVAGIPERVAMADYHAERAAWIDTAAAATALLLALGGLGSMFAWRNQMNRQREASTKQTFRLALDGAHEGFYMLRPVLEGARRIVDFTLEECNEQGAVFIGQPLEQVQGRPLSTFFEPHVAARVLAVYRGAMRRGFSEDEVRLRLADGEIRWVRRRVLRSDDGLAVTLTDITEAHVHQDALARMASTDALTGLPNRYWLQENLPRQLAQTRRPGEQMALLFVDLDNFKDINNTRGHAAGDAVLKAVAKRLSSALRPGDCIVRLGGDEFTVVLEDAGDSASISAVARRLIEALSVPVEHEDFILPALTASIGVAIHPQDGLDMQTLLKNADVAMYAAKDGGRGRSCFYTPALSASIAHRVNLVQALRDALVNKELRLHFQPRMHARSGELAGLEALVRWQHPARGLTGPLEFIPAAEEAGLIAEIGTVVIDMACAQLRAWHDAGIDPGRVAVNVSPRQFTAGALPSVVRAALERHGLAGDCLEIEITESCMLENPVAVGEDLRRLKAMGVSIAVDDFGTGYSSLAQLQNLDVDVLKIDRSFTQQLTRSEQSLAFCRTIVSMGHILGMRVVAEGVETEEQLDTLRLLACDEVQGYLLCVPMPAPALQEFMLQWGTKQQVLADSQLAPVPEAQAT